MEKEENEERILKNPTISDYWDVLDNKLEWGIAFILMVILPIVGIIYILFLVYG